MSPQPPGWGEDQPRLDDDRLPVVMVILDGLGDRPLARLGGMTPAEAAATPNLDALTAVAATGVHVPFGPGRAPTSERAHWSLLGFGGFPFPGRAVLEALGHGLGVTTRVPHFYAALRPSQVRADRVWLTGRAGRHDEEDARALLEELAELGLHDLSFRVHCVRLGEAILTVHGPGVDPGVSDSDPFFETFHPWLAPLPLAEAADPAAAERTASALRDYLRLTRQVLVSHPINRRRREQGGPALDTLTTKWAGWRTPLPTFEQRVGVRGAAVTSSALYRGLARLLDLDFIDVASGPDPGADLRERLEEAAGLLKAGARFVHVHTKATDEAGHTKDERAKQRVLEAIDRHVLRLNEEPFRSAVVALTGDHATPSSHGVIHTGDPTPLVVHGPTVRPDSVNGFGEKWAARGALGRVAADELLPLLLGLANRANLMGHRLTHHACLGLPDRPLPMRLGDRSTDGDGDSDEPPGHGSRTCSSTTPAADHP